MARQNLGIAASVLESNRIAEKRTTSPRSVATDDTEPIPEHQNVGDQAVPAIALRVSQENREYVSRVILALSNAIRVISEEDLEVFRGGALVHLFTVTVRAAPMINSRGSDSIAPPVCRSGSKTMQPSTRSEIQLRKVTNLAFFLQVVIQ